MVHPEVKFAMNMRHGIGYLPPMKYAIALALLLFISEASAQPGKKVEIKDPDLKFSYQLPDGWRSQESELYHYIISDFLHSVVSITYYEEACPLLADCYLGELEAIKLSHEENSFRLLENGTEIISGSAAMWMKYSYQDESKALPEATVYLFLFICKDQYFKVEASGNSRNADSWSGKVLGIIRSLAVR